MFESIPFVRNGARLPMLRLLILVAMDGVHQSGVSLRGEYCVERDYYKSKQYRHVMLSVSMCSVRRVCILIVFKITSVYLRTYFVVVWLC